MLALQAAVVLSLAMLAGSAAAAGSRPDARTVTLTIHAIDRTGHPVPIMTGQFLGERVRRPQGVLRSGANHLATGRYAIAVIVPTLDPQGNDIANTLIARIVAVQHNMTLTLSARHSVPVQVSLDGAALDNVIGNVCASFGSPDHAIPLLSGPLHGSPFVYIVPFRSKRLRFVYQATSTPRGGTESNLGGSFAGLPAKPVVRFTTARLARVSLRVAEGAVRPWSGHSGSFLFSPGGEACDATVTDPGQSVLDPSVTTEYFSPGTWLPTFIPNDPHSGSVGDTLTDTYAAGRSYTDTFYGAAWGPAVALPSTTGVAGTDALNIQVPLYGLFQDPSGTATDIDARADVSLTSRGRTLARQHLHNINEASFRHVVHRSGWYTAAVSATRLRAHGLSLLSPRVTVRYRFYASVLQGAVQLPLSYTQYRVGGLGLNNQATPGVRTTVRVFVVGPFGAPNRRSWHEVRIQVSFNGGRTWEALRLDRRGRDWTLTFREPLAGSVSLRSTVVGARGDSTVQTIYDAYSVG